jgi:uracil-DNA glycosylase family 4
MVISGAPRIADDQHGILFKGDDGQMLDAMLGNVLDVLRGEVYLTTVVKCRPSRGAPKPEHVSSCIPYLRQQISAVAPRVILAMGSQVTRALWSGQGTTAELRGQWRSYQGVPAMVTYHPAFLLKNPEFKRDTLEDLRAVKDKLDELRLQDAKPLGASQRRTYEAQIAALTRAKEDLKKRCLQLTQKITTLQRMVAKARTPPAPKIVRSSVPKEILDDLRVLVHPDTHAANPKRAERALRASKWVSSQRQK